MGQGGEENRTIHQWHKTSIISQSRMDGAQAEKGVVRSKERLWNPNMKKALSLSTNL